MLFRLKGSVRSIVDEIVYDVIRRVEFEGDHDFLVQYQVRKVEFPVEGQPQWIMECQIQGSWDVEPVTQDGLQGALVEVVLVSGVVPTKHLSPAVQDELRRIESELLDQASRVTSLIEWRAGIDAPHEPLTNVEFEFSLNEAQWWRLRHPSTLSVEKGVFAAFAGTSPDQIRQLIESDIREPVARNLLREAWEQRFNYPRSSLVIGVAAAETGIKQFISELSPSSAWLMQEMQAPSLRKLIRDYVPILLEGKDFPVLELPKSIVTKVAKAVEERNLIVHKPKAAFVDADENDRWLVDGSLEQALRAVSDLLWFLDYYSGRSWALGYVQTTTREEWESLSQ